VTIQNTKIVVTYPSLATFHPATNNLLRFTTFLPSLLPSPCFTSGHGDTAFTAFSSLQTLHNSPDHFLNGNFVLAPFLLSRDGFHHNTIQKPLTLNRKCTSRQDEPLEISHNRKRSGAMVCQEEKEQHQPQSGETKQAHDYAYHKRNLYLAARANQHNHRNCSGYKKKNQKHSVSISSSRFLRFRRLMATHWRNSHVEIVWTILYIGVNVFCFFSKALHYYYDHPDATAVFGNCVIIARGAANCLNLNCALILLPMCRLALTKVRGWDKRIKRFTFPLESSVLSHKIVGCIIAFWTVIHVGAHIGDFYHFSHVADKDDIVALMNGKLGIHTTDNVPDRALDRWTLLLRTPTAITGIIMVVCMDVAYVGIALQKRLGFNRFWYTHHLLIVMLLILAFHGMGNLLEPCESIYWIGFPLLLYGLPRVWRECRWFNRPRQVLELRVKEGGQVVVLRLSKPGDSSANSCFNIESQMKAGMYFNLNIPQISHFEWHPFSNTAAPGDDFIEFHIRNAGDWTNCLCDMAKDLVEQHLPSVHMNAASIITEEGLCSANEENQKGRRSGGESASVSCCCDTETLGASATSWNTELSNYQQQQHSQQKEMRSPSLKVYVEGPIGASSQGFEDYRIIVLCGGGVGATPMISVLKELLQNRSSYRMQRTYFYWTFRDLEALQWFASLLDEVFYTNNSTDHHCSVVGRELFVMRLFLTSKKEMRDCQASSFVHQSKSFRQIELNNSRMERINPHYKVDFGRPRWNKELLTVRDEAKLLGQKKAGVFVSGSPEMAREIGRTTIKISKRDPKFHFYCRKETFCSG
jgi:respiratory burst oxidase